MLHACFIPTILCFVYTLRHFYTFSGTNLLTRCHSASSCFLLFLVSEKLVKKYSRNWTEQKPKSIFCPTRHRVRRRDEVEQRGGHTIWWRGQGARHQVVWAPRGSTDLALSPI